MERLFVAALIAGVSYMAPSLAGWSGPVAVVWKGAGVALLALWAARRARGADGWLIAAVMALCAAGDVLLEVAGLEIGALAFLAGHVVAVTLYRRNGAPWGLIAAAAFAVAGVTWLILPDPGVAVYALGLGAMAGGASGARFPRRFVALGAWLFVLSDLLIFAEQGVLAGSILPRLLVWPTYFSGQALIAWGVVTTLAREGRHGDAT
jgi:uncharacterized membrane protein YhhN